MSVTDLYDGMGDFREQSCITRDLGAVVRDEIADFFEDPDAQFCNVQYRKKGFLWDTSWSDIVTAVGGEYRIDSSTPWFFVFRETTSYVGPLFDYLEGVESVYLQKVSKDGVEHMGFEVCFDGEGTKLTRTGRFE